MSNLFIEQDALYSSTCGIVRLFLSRFVPLPRLRKHLHAYDCVRVAFALPSVTRDDVLVITVVCYVGLCHGSKFVITTVAICSRYIYALGYDGEVSLYTVLNLVNGKPR